MEIRVISNLKGKVFETSTSCFELCKKSFIVIVA